MKKSRVLVGMMVAGALYASDAAAQHKAPNQQPPQAGEAPAPAGAAVTLGTIKLPKGVTADGKPLPAGTYQVRLTTQEAKPPAVGISESLERWAEFVQGGTVKGRELVTIVPQSEIKLVAKDTPPAPGAAKVQTLRGNDFVRVWFNKGGTHYLIHLPASGGAAGN